MAVNKGNGATKLILKVQTGTNKLGNLVYT